MSKSKRVGTRGYVRYAAVAGAWAATLAGCGVDLEPQLDETSSAVALPAPANIECLGQARTTVQIAWQDQAEEDGYRVDRKIGNGDWQQIAQLAANTTSFNDTNADVSSQDRHYRVTSFRASDNSTSPFSAVCNNRRIFESAHFRIFYGLRGTSDECPQAGGYEVCLADVVDGDTNIFVKRTADTLEGVIAAFDRVGFRSPGASASTPPGDLDRIPINITECIGAGGGCAGPGGIALSIRVLETPFDLATRVGDPRAWTVTLHEALHYQQYRYTQEPIRYLSDIDDGWVYEGQARSVQDKICIGADRATCNAFDDIGIAFTSYVSELQGYLANTRTAINLAAYQAVLFWTYMTEKFGTYAPADLVENGMDLMVRFWEAVKDHPGGDGIAAINSALATLGRAERFRDLWKRFAVASYAKDLTGPNVKPDYHYEDMTEPGGAYGPVAALVRRGLNAGDQIVASGIHLAPWSAHYFELTPAAGVPVVDIKITQDGSVPVYYSVLGIKGNDIAHEENTESVNLDLPLANESFDKVVVVVAGLERIANYRYSFNGTQPTLIIDAPTTGNPIRVGDPAAPGKFRVAVDVLGAEGKPLPNVDRTKFTFRVGTKDVPAEAIMTSATIQGQQWFIVQAPGQAAGGKYDLKVTYNGLSATQAQAVDYQNGKSVDTMLTIDRSGSMASDGKLVAAQDAARLYVDSWGPGDKLGVVAFEDSVDVHQDLTDWVDAPTGSRQFALNAIGGLTPGGGTAIGDAIQASWDNLNANGVAGDDWGIVLLSDGLSNTGKTVPQVIDSLVKTAGHRPVVHAIALGPDADQALMQGAAAQSGGTYQFVSAPAGTALRASASAPTPTEVALDLDQRYRVVATKLARQQQVFNLVGPKNDGDLEKDIVSIPVENGASELVISLSWTAGTLAPTLSNPQQATVAPVLGDSRHYVWRVASPSGGSWKLLIEDQPIIVKIQGPRLGDLDPLPPVEALAPYLVHAAVRSQLLMETYLPVAAADRISGAAMPILVGLTDTGPVTGATVTAAVATPGGGATALTLFDDGRHGDGAAGDGIYGGSFRDTAAPGSYVVKVFASGNSALTGAFTRQDTAAFFIDGGGDGDGDGIPDSWERAHGTNPGAADADADPDNDGLSNRQEWLLGTDPQNPDTDSGGEADGTDPHPLDGSDDHLQPPSTVAFPGTSQVFVRYLVRPEYAQVWLLRGSTASGPFSLVQDASPGGGMFTDASVVNGTTYCYLTIAFDGLNRRSVSDGSSCATPRADPFPPHGDVQINGGQRVAVSPKVTLTLQASDVVVRESVSPGDPVPLPSPSSASGVTAMRIGNLGDLSDGVWEPYTTTRKWTLAQSSGLARVFVQYRDAAGNESSIASAAIKIVPLDLASCTKAPLGQANNFNLFTFGDLTQSGTDVGGRVAVGGNAKLNNYSVGSKLPNSHGSRDDLIVDSRITYTDGTIANGNATFGGTASLTRVTLANGQSRKAHPLSFAGERVQLELESTAWGTLTPNGTTTVQYFGGPTAQITLTGGNAKLNVFAVAGKDLSAANTLTIKVPAGATVIVNVDGAALQLQNFGIVVTGTDRQRVLYNLFEARTLTIASIAVQGTILAPYAAIGFSNGAIDGTLVGSSISGSGESHQFPFQGCIPVPASS